MKFYLSQISQLFEGIGNSSIKALLLYGPDKGYIDKVCKSLIKQFELSKISIEYSELKQKSLETLANTQSFFTKKQLIVVKSTGESIDKKTKLTLAKDSVHFVVFIADELPLSSTIRKFFEIEPYLASLACYHDDSTKIAKIIVQKCHNAGKTINEDAVSYLTSCLKTDHLMIINEIDKLIYYTFDKKQITFDDAKCAVGQDHEGSGDDLCVYFALKNYSKFLQEFTKLKQYNINEVLIIKALIRYYLKLYTVLCKLEIDSDLDKAVKSLTPPIFYKYVQDFKKAVNLHKLEHCIKILNCLQQAELEYKLSPHGFDIYSILSIRSNY